MLFFRLSKRFIFVLLLVSTSAYAAPADDKIIHKTIKTLMASIQHAKYDLASKQINYDIMTQLLVGPSFKQFTQAEQTEIIQGVQTLVSKISFQRGHDMFEHLDAVLYNPAHVQQDEAHCKTTVVVHRNYKKAEIPIEWVLHKDAKGWRIADTVIMGESTAESVKEEQVQPLLRKGGAQAVLKALRAKIAELKI